MSDGSPFRMGNQTAWSAKNILDPFEYAVANGFRAFEWFPDRKESGEGWSEEDLAEETRLYIKDTAKAADIRLSVHVPWQWNPFLPGSEERAEKAVRLARDVGAVLFNIHFYREHGVQAFADALERLLQKLSKSGIRLSVENTPESGPDDLNEFFHLLRKSSVSGAQVGMCLDLGHANLHAATRNDYLRYIDLLSPDVPVIHVHMHENYGDRDSHLPLFTGPAGKDPSGVAGFVKRMKNRGFSGCLIFEQWPDPPDLLVEARDRLSAIIGIPGLRVVRPRVDMPGGDFAEVIATADKKNRSWREKLGWVRDLFSENAPVLTDDQLTYLAIYLRFLGSGEVPTEEDGSHYRPSHHARMAGEIFRRLTAMTTDENAFVIRKIYPWLPSFDSPFLRAEPLTRIRDIAHRNDIPGELKREIKTTLQNKLHRNAGPEDLATSTALLKRITAPDTGYPAAFIEEFRKFHEELKEFFNARSMDEQLAAVARAEGGKDAEVIGKFLEAKATMEEPGSLKAVFELLTELRERFERLMKERKEAENQQLQIADIRMEEFAFVLLSRYVNRITEKEAEPDWNSVLQSLALTVANLRLGGFDREECRAIEAELDSWREGFDRDDRDHFLRLKATLDRSLRLSEVYTRKILNLFPEKAEKLGKALGVQEHAARAFSEADIRSHPVFQLSKLAAFLLRKVRKAAALPPWDVIVPGRASGRLAAASRLPNVPGSYEGPVVAVLDRIEGDEEIPARVAGLIVPHETPHLSHLAVRARQAGVVFAVCEDEDLFRSIKGLSDRDVLFDAAGQSPGVAPSAGDSLVGASNRSARPPVRPGSVSTAESGVLDLGDVTTDNAGSKAYGARRLRELSENASVRFRTPESAVIPFGVMQRSFGASAALQKKYQSLRGKLGGAQKADFEGILDDLAGIIRKLEVPDAVILQITDRFGQGKRLMVRSSSNCEDLEGLSGAGLYETVANVTVDRLPEAVKNVWASLWTKRAAASRATMGIAHEEAHMAVLIQEMLVPDYSFIIHTVNPATGKRDEIYIEMACGLGEALASGEVPGTPYRMVCSGENRVNMLSFASFSRSVLPGPSGGLVKKTMNYAEVRLSVDKEFRNASAMRLAGVARFVEKELGRPQDMEGLLSGDDVWLVQSRPQQGISVEA